MQLMKQRRSIVLAVIGLTIVTTSALVFATTLMSANSPTLVGFNSVSASALEAHNGLMLTAPSDANASDASTEVQSRAEKAANQQYHAAVLESHYAHCVGTGVSQDCWAIGLDPSNYAKNLPSPAAVGSYSPPKLTNTTPDTKPAYLIALVDPSTGEVLGSVYGGP
jgi:hypothetical protein